MHIFDYSKEAIGLIQIILDLIKYIYIYIYIYTLINPCQA